MKLSEGLSRYYVFLTLLYPAMHETVTFCAFLLIKQWLEEINILSIIMALFLCHSLFFSFFSFLGTCNQLYLYLH